MTGGTVVGGTATGGTVMGGTVVGGTITGGTTTPATVVGGGTQVTAVHEARLGFAVVDLTSRKVVWDGAVYGSAGTVVALEQSLEDNLLEALGIEQDHPKRHRW